MKFELFLIMVKLHLVRGSNPVPYLNVGKNLTSVPANIPGNVNIINLSNSKIHNLLDQDFLNFNALTEINLTSNIITRIDQNLFSPTIHSNLEVILLRDNVIEAMPSFDGFNSLRTLDISNNLLQNLTLGQLDNLENLDVSYNNLNEMPVLTNMLTTLKVLKIVKNNIITIPVDYFANTPALEELDLKLNHIREINLEYLIHLISLNISNNELQDIPRITHKLTSLETMVFDSNQISKIPQGYFENIPSLKILKLSSNPLISFDCTGLFELRELRLSRTNLNEFPNITDCFTSLEKLYVQDLRGKLVKKGIEMSLVFGSSLTPITSQSLKRIELRSTFVGNLPSWFLFSLPNLEILDVAETNLTEMPDISKNTK